MNQPAIDPTTTTAGARLRNKVVILTGAAGNIGTHISRHLLREGAKVVMTGRNEAKLSAFIEELAAEGFEREHMEMAIGDSAQPEICRRIVAQTVERYGRIDVLVNNAGGAGPRRTLRDIPFSEAERKARGDDETMYDAAMNLLAGPWNMVRAAVPHMSRGGSIVNVSTIFSRTHYYGRIPYVVPKSGLNALSIGLAKELGDEYGIRVNTLFPGPIESERIDTVFSNMDALQSAPSGTTSQEFRGLMIARRETPEGEFDYRYPTPDGRGLDHHLPGLGRVGGPLRPPHRGHERHAGTGAEPLEARVLAGQASRGPDRSGGAHPRRQRLRGCPGLRRAAHDERRAS
jgi:malonyl-CoA reductase/3-hydroxypropionate dehydrogenase (NADP+)